MALTSFIDWMHQQDESSAFTRLRRDAALGLKPEIPGAAVHSRSTAHPFEVDKLGDKHKHKCKCKGKSKKKDGKCGCKKSKKNEWISWLEAKERPQKNPQVDKWLEKVGELKDEVEKTKSKKKEDDIKAKVDDGDDKGKDDKADKKNNC